MGRRWALWTWAVCGALSLFACAEGSPSAPFQYIPPPEPMVQPLCGNNRVDPMEQCECPNKATTGQCPIDGMTCNDLGMGTGPLLCNAAPLCTFNFSMCPMARPAVGSGAAGTGTGGSGAAGTGTVGSGAAGTGTAGRGTAGTGTGGRGAAGTRS